MNSKASFEEFRDVVLADEHLQEELRRFSDRRDFVARIIELGREYNFDFTTTDIEEEMSRGRRMWNEHGQ